MSGSPGQRARPGSGAMFDAIAPGYQRLNRLLSLGLDRGWRARTVEALGLPVGPSRVLDVATGTADVPLAVTRAWPQAEVVGLDPSRGMLRIGVERIAAARLEDRIRLVAGDAAALPLGDQAFDAATIAFGVRNLPDRSAALRELRRVIRPGGTLAILELAEPSGGLLAPLVRFHIRCVVPVLGAWLSDRSAYEHLTRSMAAFPPPGVFAASIGEAGFEAVEIRRLAFGAVHLFLARR